MSDDVHNSRVAGPKGLKNGYIFTTLFLLKHVIFVDYNALTLDPSEK